jgi:hypothetical protein
MTALIGLFVGAFVGHMLWRDWGAALGGVAGFIIGAKLNALRKGTGARPGAPSAIPAPPQRATLDPPTERERALLLRVSELERRVAHLETRSGTTAANAGVSVAPRSAAALGDDTTTPAAAGVAAAPGGEGSIPVWPPVATTIDSPLPKAETAVAGAHPSTGGRRDAATSSFAGGRGNEPGMGVVHRRQRADAHRRCRAVFWRRLPASLLRRAFHVPHRAPPRDGCRMRFRADPARRMARPLAARVRLSLEGAGAGILYLTTFAAFRLYGVLPEVTALVLLVLVSAASVWLAVRNDSQPLAGLASAGGFLAPMLVAHGGEPVQLFGYFAVLNGAIFALAWARAWRGLNAVGFVFTFVLAAFWGHGFYRPEHYAVVQPFLVLFFVFYVIIAILYAKRGPIAAKDPVDALLVFGVPIAGFALQAAIVRDARYGAAWSAIAMGVFYLILFALLRRRAEPGFALLARAFLALGVVFATIAVPFAFDRRATAALWAVEAAGVYWIGVRQRAQLVRGFALAIEVGAGIVFAASGVASRGDPLFANAFFAGAILIAASGLVSARIADRAGESLTASERSVVPLIFAWGVLWWLGAGGVELARQLSRAAGPHAVLAWVTGSIAAAFVLARFLGWSRLLAAGFALLPAMALVALADFERARTTLTVYGWLIWPCAWLAHWQALRQADAKGFGSEAESGGAGRGRLLRAAHAASALMLTAQVAWEASEWTGRATETYTVWTACAAALPAIVFLLLCVRFHDSARWPAQPHRDAYALGAGGPIVGLLTVWFFVVNAVSPGDPSPLPYIPVANPLDVTLALALVALVAWARRFADIRERALYLWAGAGLFVALNGLVIRAAHHWGDIPWRLTSLLASKPLQAALTLTWTATALALMYMATRRSCGRCGCSARHSSLRSSSSSSSSISVRCRGSRA